MLRNNFILILLVFRFHQTDQFRFWCDFDHGENCLPGIEKESTILLDNINGQPQQPASDVTAIQTANNLGECKFPSNFSNLEMFFCTKTVKDQSATCKTSNSVQTELNCNSGEYAFQKFNQGGPEEKTYRLDNYKHMPQGTYCFRIYYFFSDNIPKPSIEVTLENTDRNLNQTAFQVSSMPHLHRWNEFRANVTVVDQISEIYFTFQAKPTTSSAFFIAIDEIAILDLPCPPNSDLFVSTTAPVTTTAAPVTTTGASQITTTREIITTKRPSSAVSFNLRSQSGFLLLSIFIQWTIFNTRKV